MQEALITVAEVQRLTGYSRSEIYRLAAGRPNKEGGTLSTAEASFPKPVKLGEPKEGGQRFVPSRWVLSEVNRWIEDRKASRKQAQPQQLAA